MIISRYQSQTRAAPPRPKIHKLFLFSSPQQKQLRKRKDSTRCPSWTRYKTEAKLQEKLQSCCLPSVSLLCVFRRSRYNSCQIWERRWRARRTVCVRLRLSQCVIDFGLRLLAEARRSRRWQTWDSVVGSRTRRRCRRRRRRATTTSNSRMCVRACEPKPAGEGV